MGSIRRALPGSLPNPHRSMSSSGDWDRLRATFLPARFPAVLRELGPRRSPKPERGMPDWRLVPTPTHRMSGNHRRAGMGFRLPVKPCHKPLRVRGGRIGQSRFRDPFHLRLAYRSSTGTTFWPYALPTYSESGRKRRLSLHCSSTWAVQPLMREMAKMGVKRSVGIPRLW